MNGFQHMPPIEVTPQGPSATGDQTGGKATTSERTANTPFLRQNNEENESARRSPGILSSSPPASVEAAPNATGPALLRSSISIDELRTKSSQNTGRCELSLDELRTNPELARRVLLSLWRDGLVDKQFRFVVLRDLADLLATYGSIEPVYSFEAGARLCGASLPTFKSWVRKFAADLQPPYYTMRSIKRGRGFRQKVRFIYATDIQTIREKIRRKVYWTGKYSRGVAKDRRTAAYHRRRTQQDVARMDRAE